MRQLAFLKDSRHEERVVLPSELHICLLSFIYLMFIVYLLHARDSDGNWKYKREQYCYDLCLVQVMVVCNGMHMYLLCSNLKIYRDPL